MPAERIDLFRPFAALSLFILRSSGDAHGAGRPIAFDAISDAMRSSLGLVLTPADLQEFVRVLDDSSMLTLSYDEDEDDGGSLSYTVGLVFAQMDMNKLVDVFAAKQAAAAAAAETEDDSAALPLSELASRICDAVRMRSVLDATVPEAAAEYAEPTTHIDPHIWTALHQARGIERLYTHQVHAIDCILQKQRSVVVSTATASGKSVIYQVPVLQTLLDDAQATMLLVFPTKALAQDQLGALRQLADHIPQLKNIVIDTFDGDQTSRDRRRAIRDTASIILTNPDTLHAAMLPNVSAWRWFWLRLRLVVIDELHVYQAQFGQHVSHVLRRLQRQCSEDQQPVRYIACSATTSNAAEHLSALTGLIDIDVVDSDGSPRGTKHLALWDAADRHVSPIADSSNVAVRLLARGLRTIVFCRSRQTCELVFREICDSLALSPQLRALRSQVMSYRAGYTVAERRAIEQALFTGDTRLVVATSALELGIDIGSLDAVLMVGVPVSAAALCQQAGRAGRRSADSLAIIVATDTPLDRRAVDSPAGLFDRAFAPASIADEPSIAAAHLQCAAFELPLAKDEFDNTDGLCWDPSTQKWICSLSYKPWPPEKVPIRSIQQTTWQVIETRHARAPSLLEELDAFRALFTLYEGGILLHRGHSFSIDSVDPDHQLALVSRTNVSWYTEQRDYINVVPLSVITRSTPFLLYGKLSVTTTVFGYKRIDAKSRKTLEFVEHASPPLSISTRGLWVDIPHSLARSLASNNHNIEASIHAAQHALIATVTSLIGCMSGDLCTECKSPFSKRSKIPPMHYSLISLSCIVATASMFTACNGLYTPGKFTLSEYINSMHKRDNSFVTNYLTSLHAGLLVKAGEQTFCSVIPITQQYAFVAASCFDFADGNVDDNTDYKVYLSGTGYETPTLMDVTSIQARDDYDPDTFANNLAIITIANTNTAFSNKIGEPASAWATINYIQQSLVEDLSSWNAPDIYSGTSIDSSTCKSASSLYKANTDTLSCNSQTRNSFINTNCKTPLKFAVGSSGGMVAVVGLYSYSAISGTPEDGFCNDDNTIVSYYTNLYDYVPWASEIIGITLKQTQQQE
ncbi:ATP-dependent 3'-5' DNA helicase [Coemansia sp. RSA 1933]|nr:ATP-dependent 3'-5' DNA helicase [Coemansia sp. RSA 1933]